MTSPTERALQLARREAYIGGFHRAATFFAKATSPGWIEAEAIVRYPIKVPREVVDVDGGRWRFVDHHLQVFHAHDYGSEWFHVSALPGSADHLVTILNDADPAFRNAFADILLRPAEEEWESAE